MRLCLSLECPWDLGVLPLLALQLVGLLKLNVVSTRCLKTWEQEPKHKSAPWPRAAPISRSHQVLRSSGRPGRGLPGPVPRRELGRLCDGLWCGNQMDCSVGTTLRACPSPRLSDMGAFLSKTGGGHQPLRLSWCFYPSAKDPSWQTCSGESSGTENLGGEHLNSSFFNLDHGLRF